MRTGSVSLGVWAIATIASVGSGAAQTDPTLGARADATTMEVAVCAALAAQSGPEGLTAAVESVGWGVEAALETAECRFIFIDGGAPSPAGHHIVARWGNFELIPWLARRALDRGDPGGPRRIFGRSGESGTALDYLDAMIAQFDGEDPAMADLFRWARQAVEVAVAPEPFRYHAE